MHPRRRSDVSVLHQLQPYLERIIRLLHRLRQEPVVHDHRSCDAELERKSTVQPVAPRDGGHRCIDHQSDVPGHHHIAVLHQLGSVFSCEHRQNHHLERTATRVGADRRTTCFTAATQEKGKVLPLYRRDLQENLQFKDLQVYLQFHLDRRICSQLSGVDYGDIRHNTQPEGLRTSQFAANIIVIVLVNLQLFLEMQADSWQDIWYDSSKK